MKIISWPPVTTLPNDMIMEILSRLPVTTLLRFKSASKSFFNLIISPEFVKLHLRRSLIRNCGVTLLYSWNAFLAYFDFDYPQRPVVQLDMNPDVIKLFAPHSFDTFFKTYPHMIGGICNGVVCFEKDKEFVLYNPATRAYRQIPKLEKTELCHAKMHNDEMTKVCNIFVYDCNGGDFKIFSCVTFVYYSPGPDQNDFEFYLYSLKDNSRFKIESPLPGLQIDPSCTHNANNSLYWITIKDRLQTKVIMRFDVSSHRYEEMSTPKQIDPAHILKVRVLKGRPHVLILGSPFDIWMITEDNFWTPVFRCSTKQYRWRYQPDSPYWRNKIGKMDYAYSRDGRKIFIEAPIKRKCLYCCDLESQTTSTVKPLGLLEDAPLIAMSWVESLVPLA